MLFVVEQHFLCRILLALFGEQKKPCLRKYSQLEKLASKKNCSHVTLLPPPDIFLHILTFSFGGKAGVDVPKDKSFPAFLLPPSLKSRKRRRKERESGVSPLPSPGQMGGKDAKTKGKKKKKREIHFTGA